MNHLRRRELYVLLLRLRCSLPVWQRVDYIGGSHVLPPPLAGEEDPKIHVLGDAHKVGNLMSVIWEAYDIAYKI